MAKKERRGREEGGRDGGRRGGREEGRRKGGRKEGGREGGICEKVYKQASNQGNSRVKIFLLSLFCPSDWHRDLKKEVGATRRS